MKTKIFLATYNRPDFLEKQLNSLEKYFTKDYTPIVLHDSRGTEYCDEFDEICSRRNVDIFHHKSPVGKSPSQYHADVIQWGYDNVALKDYDDQFAMFLDHDMFLIEEFDIISYMNGYSAAGCLQKRGNVEYLWPGITIFRMDSVADLSFTFSPGVYHGQSLDTGGGTCDLLRVSGFRYKDTIVEYPNEYQGINLSSSDVHMGYPFELHLHGKFLHYRNACSWHNNFQLFEKTRKDEIFNVILDSFLDSGDILMKEYHTFATTKSEINEHLPTLYSLAKECDSIVELGVCHGKSTRALLASGTKLRSYDVWIEPRVLELFKYSKSIGNDVDYIQQNSVHAEIPECDMLFIDSWHNYYQLRKELKLHADKSRKYIVFHDTVSCGSVGEDWKSWGNGSRIQYEQLCKDLDAEEIDTTGINSAIFEFLSNHHEWKIKVHYKNNNGLTVIERHG